MRPHLDREGGLVRDERCGLVRDERCGLVRDERYGLVRDERYGLVRDESYGLVRDALYGTCGDQVRGGRTWTARAALSRSAACSWRVVSWRAGGVGGGRGPFKTRLGPDGGGG